MPLHAFADRRSFSSRFLIYTQFLRELRRNIGHQTRRYSLWKVHWNVLHFIALYSTCFFCCCCCWNMRELRIKMYGVLFEIVLRCQCFFFLCSIYLFCFLQKRLGLLGGGRWRFSWQFWLSVLQTLMRNPARSLRVSLGFITTAL